MTRPIRIAREDDAAAVAAIYAPIVEATATSFEETPPPPDEMWRRMAVVLRTHPWLVCEDERGVIGYAYGAPHRARRAYRWATETSVYIAERARRSGVGRALYEVLLSLLAAQGYERALAGVSLPNEASVRLHESFGFEPVGVYRRVGFKFGVWHDVGWWQLDLASPDRTPTEPIPFAEFAETPQCDLLLGGELSGEGSPGAGP